MAEFRRNANAIAGRAATRLSQRFSTLTVTAGSDARPEISADFEKFSELARRLETYADRLGISAEEGDATPSSMRMKTSEATEGGPSVRKAEGTSAGRIRLQREHAFHMMLQTCTAYHAGFRLER